jgi:prepilin-type N-terminal cleavage/methylation domain-containing protein
MTRHPNRHGFTLLEMTAVLVILGAIMTLGGALILTSMRADQVGANTLRQLTRHAELADQFRADVGRAVAAPERFEAFTAGPDCLILRFANGSHVVYVFDAGKESLVREVRGEKPRRQPLPTGSDKATVKFIRPAGEQPVITMRVDETPARGVPRRVEFSAALGGDVR